MGRWDEVTTPEVQALRRAHLRKYKRDWARRKYRNNIEQARARSLTKARARAADAAVNRHDKDVRNERDRYIRAVTPVDQPAPGRWRRFARGHHERTTTGGGTRTDGSFIAPGAIHGGGRVQSTSRRKSQDGAYRE